MSIFHLNIFMADDILTQISKIESNTDFLKEIMEGFSSIALDRFSIIEKILSVETSPVKPTQNIQIDVSKDENDINPPKEAVKTPEKPYNLFQIDGITQKGIESLKKALFQIDLKSVLFGSLVKDFLSPKVNVPALQSVSNQTGKADMTGIIGSVDNLGKSFKDLNKQEEVDTRPETPSTSEDDSRKDYSEEDVFKDDNTVKIDGFTVEGKTEFQELLGGLSKDGKGSGDGKEITDILKALSKGKDGGSLGMLESVLNLFGISLSGTLATFGKTILPKLMGTLTGTITKAFGVLFSSVGIAVMSIGASVIMFIKDGIAGLFKAKEWGVSGVSGMLGGLFGGVGKTFLSRFTGQVLKYGLLGLGIGSVVPGIGTIIGAVVGVVIGSIMALIGGERIAQFFDQIGEWGKQAWKWWAGVFKDLFEGIKNVGVKVYQGLKWYFWDMPISLWTSIFNGIQKAFNWVSTQIATKIEWLKEKFVKVTDFLSSIGEMLVNGFSSVIEAGKEKVSNIWEGIKTNFMSQFNILNDLLGGIPKKIINYVADMWKMYAPKWLGGGKEDKNTVTPSDKTLTSSQKESEATSVSLKEPDKTVNKSEPQKSEVLQEIRKTNKESENLASLEMLKRLEEVSNSNKENSSISKEQNDKTLELTQQMVELLSGIYQKPVSGRGSSNTNVYMNNVQSDAWIHRQKYAE